MPKYAKNGFVLVETIVAVSIFVMVSLLIGDLLISSVKISDNATRKYQYESMKNNTILLLYGNNFYADSNTTRYSMIYTDKYTIVCNSNWQKGLKKYDIIWKK